MSHYVSSYHSNRKKQIIIQTVASIGILVAVAVIIWFVFSKSDGQDKLLPQMVEQKPVALPDSNKPAQPTMPATPAIPQPAITQPVAAAPAAITQTPQSTPAAAAIDPSVDTIIKNAFDIANTNPIAARDMLNDILTKTTLSPQQTQDVKTKMSSLADYWLFSRKVFPDDPLCGTYIVQSGDMLIKIAPKFKVPYEILMQINDIKNASSLRKGQEIKIINGPFNVKVNRSTFTVDVYLQDTFVRSFKAGLGLPNRQTPTGFWVVKFGGKAVQPQWYDKDINKTYNPGDTDYPLGTRWIELHGLEGDAIGQTGIAFHGTNEPQTIGTQCSRGCVRMLNSDVEILYNLLEPGCSNVRITD